MTDLVAHLVVIAAVAGPASALALVDRRLKAARLYRARLMFHVIREGGEAGWVSSRDIAAKFGPGVYPTLHRLEARGLLLRREGPTDLPVLVARGGRPTIWYRVAPNANAAQAAE